MYNSVEPVVTGQPVALNAYPPQDNQYPTGMYGNASTLNVKGPNNNHHVSWVGQHVASGVFPPAVQYLSNVDQLLVKQQIEILEVLSGYDAANKYVITNNLGQKVFYAVEELDCRPSMCCGSARSFEMKILDNFGLEVMHIHRPFKCPCCFGCSCCLQEVEVSSPPGTIIGKVLQRGGCCNAGHFTILDKDMEPVLLIKGSCCHCECCSDIDFQILCKNGINEVGKITKQWGGFAQEMVTNADNFGLTFPVDIDVSQKATLLGALFLIDFIFFEQQKKRR